MTNPSTAIHFALVAAKSAAPFPPSGCGRAYVVVYGLKGPAKAAFTRALKAHGLRMLPQGIYFGYDNATGRVLGQAEAFAESLKSQGFSAYMEAVAD